MKVHMKIKNPDPLDIFNNANIHSNICLFCQPVFGMRMFETENFQLLRVNFPAEKGHLMIASKMHYGSGGEIDDALFPELVYMKEQVTKWFRKHLSNIVFYEHGRAGGCLTSSVDGTQCEHFHLNLLPLDICINETLKKHYDSILLKSYEDIKENFNQYGDYLYFENNEEEKYFYPVQHKKVPPHFLRSLVCEKINKTHRANWQKHQSYSEFLESYHLTKPFETYAQKNLVK